MLAFLESINRAGHTKMNIRLLMVLIYTHQHGHITNQQAAELLESHVNKVKDLLCKACDRGLLYRCGLERVQVTSYRGTPDNTHKRHNNVQIYKLTEYSHQLINEASDQL
jgi:hypothetical protein